MEMGGQPGSEAVPSPVLMERGTWQPRLPQRPHPSLVQPFTHLVEGMMPIQNGEHQGFDSTPTREAMRRMGRDEAINHGGNLQTP